MRKRYAANLEPKEMAIIKRLRSQGLSFETIGRRLGRSKESVRVNYLKAYGLSGVKNVWLEEHDNKLREMAKLKWPVAKMASVLDRSVAAVKRRLSHIGSGARSQYKVYAHMKDAKAENSSEAADRIAAKRGSEKLLAAYQRYFRKYHPESDVARMAA